MLAPEGLPAVQQTVTLGNAAGRIYSEKSRLRYSFYHQQSTNKSPAKIRPAVPVITRMGTVVYVLCNIPIILVYVPCIPMRLVKSGYYC